MIRLTCVLSCGVMLAACSTTSAPSAESTSAEETEDPTEPTNSHGLTLADARGFTSELRLGMLQRDVKKLLGQPDQKDSVTLGGHVGWERWEGPKWTYEWELPESGFIRFFIVFEGDYSTAPISHFFWRHES